MKQPAKAQYTATGHQAIKPSAIGMMFTIPASRANTRIGDVEIVEVSGPLDSHDCGFGSFDSYDAIRDRFATACRSDASTVCLLVDSPGGAVFNAFDTARQLRAMAASAGKRFIAYADESCCSAGYALASAASHITAASSSTVGSVGVVTTRDCVLDALAKDGVRTWVIASGKAKASAGRDLTPVHP